ncbi:MAG: MG2 domain-containing protein [Sediminicola sp.]
MKYPYLSFLLLILVFSGCSKKPGDTTTELSDFSKYADYISQVSHGVVSTQSDIRVVLAAPVAGWKPQEEVDQDLLLVSPKTKGKVVALDDRTLSFVPATGFEQDTEYVFTLLLQDIIKDVPKDQRTFTFGVKTLKQQFNVYSGPIRSHSKDWQYLEGQLRSADQLSLQEAKKLISARQNGKKIKISFDGLVKTGTLFQFRLDSIQRYEEDSELILTWDGKSVGSESTGTNSIQIPGKKNFSVLNVEVGAAGKQELLINFSDPLKKGQNIKGLVVLQGDDDPKFSIDGNLLRVYPSKEIKGTVQLEVFKGVESAEGYKLKHPFTGNITFDALKPEIRLLSSGTILPSSNNLKVNFEAVNLKAVDVSVLKIYGNNVLQFLQGNDLKGDYNLRTVARPIATKKLILQNNLSQNNGKWAAHAVDLKELITPEPGAIYRIEFSIKPSYGQYGCETTNFTPDEGKTEDFDQEEESSNWDGSESYYNDYGYDYDWNERENPCHTSYYWNKNIGVNVLATDIGLVVKKGLNNKYFVVANDIVTTNSLSGAKVTFHNFQQQELGYVVTGADGTAVFASENIAYFAVADHKGQKTYLKLNDGNALSLSKFDVSGVELQKGIKGYIFGERGVWRPGDPIFLSFMLNDNANKLPSGHPVKLELMDPYFKVVHREVQSGALNNFFTFKLSTDPNAPTGNWLAKISVGGASFTKTLKIETIKPNRLKIRTAFEQDVLSGTVPIQGGLEVAWLHGAIAKNLKADISAKFNQQATVFPSFPGYVFDDPTRSFSTEEQVVFNGKLNGDGKADFTISPQLKGQAPGMLKAAFITKVYENGGDFSTDVFTKTYSPFNTYVGLNVPKGDKARGMLLTDTKHTFEVATVDGQGRPKAVKGLKVAIYKINWRWWWDTSGDNLSSFDKGEYKEKIFETTLGTNSTGKGSFNFELKYPDWGRYLVIVEDTQGGHATGKTLYIDWPGWAGKSRKGDPSEATMLVFSTDREQYKVGETATVTFPSPENGRALVTLENGTEVLESMWIEATKGETKFQLPITEKYTPTIFLNITLLQPHASTLNDSPIRMYGIVPIAVENPSTKLEPEIGMPEVLRPEERITVKVKEKKGRAMTYNIAIVDEGLLDLTRFNTPDPWNAFYAREALGVKTWDMYDEVIGAFGGKIDQVFAIGGDGELAGARNKKANRFEPMVLYLGPFALKAGETGSHKIQIPKYVGSVRTMVVAGNVDSEAYGMAEKTTPVRKPLMVLASLPRKMTPGEKVTLPVTVFAMESKVKKVTVSLKQDSSFKIVGSASKTITFSQTGEQMVYFDLEVAPSNGIGKIVVSASGNGESASFEVPMDIVNPNPVTTEVHHLILEPNSSQTMDLQTFGVTGTNAAKVEFSTLPPMNFNGRMSYLIQYPHGCVEQITSAAFPQLYLNEIFDLAGPDRSKTQKNVQDAVQRLGGYQLPNGGFPYWPGQQQPNDWGTSYAGHFLLEAGKRGYVLPIGFQSSWVRYQQQTAKLWRAGNNFSDLAQAYRLYTLALSGNADIASMNRLRESDTLSNEAVYRLAAAYAVIGQTKVAQTLLTKAQKEFDGNGKDHYTYGSAERNVAMSLETLVLLKDRAKAQELARELAKDLNGDQWMSTQTTAYGLLAMAKFAELVGGKGVKGSVTVNGKTVSIATSKTLAGRPLEIKEGKNGLLLKNLEGNTLFVSVVQLGILPVGEEKVIQNNLSAKMVFRGRDGSILDVSQIAQGTDFVAEATLTNTTSREIKDMALTEIFPSGWEIVNTRFTDFGDFAENKVAYTDLRDDRANFYFDLGKNETKTFKILLNASFLGTYYMPGIQAEAMYDHNYLVRTKGQWVDVVQ